MTATGGGHGSGGDMVVKAVDAVTVAVAAVFMAITIHLLLSGLSLNWLTTLFLKAALVILHYAM